MTKEQRLNQITAIDREYWARGIIFAGIDEAGRGPLAGPVYAGCAVMPEAPLLLDVNDSKKLSEARRESVYEQILETVVFAGVGFASVSEIESLNILGATRLAMQRAAEGANCDLFLLDAVEGVPLKAPQRAFIGGDAKVYAIAAASILAKVARDRAMRALDEKYPQYGFARHKGYGTKEHIEAIRAHGPCPEHRALFLRKII